MSSVQADAKASPTSQRVPVLGPRVPRRGNAMSRWLGHAVLALLGWRVAGEMPDARKFIIIGAPHTSNLDGLLGMAALMAMGLRANTMIKDSLFRGPLGPLLRWLGALPIDRASPKGVVEQSIDAFARSEALVLLITPEGTRKAAPEFKSGFYRIALGAGVPIVPAAANYRIRAAILGEPMLPSGDYAADLARLIAYFRRQGAPCRPERLSLPLRDS